MPSITAIQKRIWDFYAASGPDQREIFLENVKNNAPVFLPDGEEAILFFSDFNEAHKKRVKAHLGSMISITSGTPDFYTGVGLAMDYLESMDGKENPDILCYALDLYMLHYAKVLPFETPSILVKSPELVAASRTEEDTTLEFATGNEEPKLDWFREDALLNAHHTHWHQVYTDGSRDRHGEMFLYMHQQMIARYNAERLAAELQEVRPFNNLVDNPIKVGYLMGPDARLSIYVGADRPENVFVPEADARDLQRQLAEMNENLDNGTFDSAPADPQNFEAETNAITRFGLFLEQTYHNQGHGAIASVNRGVMGATIFAIRDVVFWEWHKGIDDLGYKWQQRQVPYNFTAEKPPVAVRKSTDDDNLPFTPDLILAFQKDIPGINQQGFNGHAVGQAAFGGENWNKEFIEGTHSFTGAGGSTQSISVTRTLRTSMKTGKVTYRVRRGERSYDYTYLSHEPFAYFIRLENDTLVEKQVTVRLFMVPEEWEEDRRMWIEMDKFLHVIPPQSKVVAFRKDAESSIIRKPAVKDPATHNVNFNPVDIPEINAQCNCGWPYHLIIPRGNKTGMFFKLMMIVTDAALDLVGPEPDCGSLSFCGAQDDRYPDKRPLGYPFNRRFNGNGKAISEAIATTPNMGSRSIMIKHE